MDQTIGNPSTVNTEIVQTLLLFSRVLGCHLLWNGGLKKLTHLP